MKIAIFRDTEKFAPFFDAKKRLNKVINQLLYLIAFCPFILFSQEVENVMETRISPQLFFKIDAIDDLEFSIAPELRFDNEFKIKRVFLENGIEYKVVKFLSLSAAYRFIISNDNGHRRILNYISLSANIKEKINRFKVGLRIRYSNYADDDNVGDNNNFIRFRTSVDYDIKNCKLRPNIGAEIFSPINDKQPYKYRYSAGVSYKVSNKNSISVGYRLDYYLKEYKNKHIAVIGYKYEL